MPENNIAHGLLSETNSMADRNIREREIERQRNRLSLFRKQNAFGSNVRIPAEIGLPTIKTVAKIPAVLTTV